MRKIRVFQVSKLYYPWIGGVETVVQDIAEGLNDKVDMEVLVCQPKGQGECELINRVKVTKTSSLGIYFSMPVSITFPFLLAWKSRKADILHFHLPFPLGVLSYLLMGSKRKKMVVSYHFDIVRQKKLLKYYRFFLHQFLKRANVILATSPKLIESSEHLRLYKNKCIIVPYSIDLNEFIYFVKREFNLGVSPHERIVLFVGRLIYYKGLEYLIEAMQDVEAKLLIVGEGVMRDELEVRAKTLGVDHKIIFLGKVSDEKLKYCYQICDLFVLPSVESSEAFGIVQMEAMAYGKPIINTSLPTSVPYVSVNGETGITVSPKDSKALGEAINEILKNKELSSKFSKNALRRVREKFSREKMLELIYSIYDDLMKQNIFGSNEKNSLNLPK